ncbi:DNA-3-methyladenine glycosylase I [Deminuibacter soli]|uniref:DNA-3-methyladenine glycosylase I n=1 Tax=Deminuibacter soli TaxID=2291815 RepID=A0A3E1NK58_9BACT|nr:DNA-3-methyladenine glycosylase I [Deminuibacter soli]RFM28320.1 DNA-3-methyladenine glycosylase I [Deminuibacter soli]
MEQPFDKTYCGFVHQQPEDSVHRVYHDTEYGFPLDSDDALFGRLLLEINQAGLSWTTILNKKANFYKAYDKFSIKKIARYDEAKVDALLQDAGIIRNRLKVAAAVYNAQQVLVLQKSHGSFKQWIEAHHPMGKDAWVKLFKKTFRFTGGEIVESFLLSTGYLPGAHHKNCPVYKQLKQLHKIP